MALLHFTGTVDTTMSDPAPILQNKYTGGGGESVGTVGTKSGDVKLSPRGWGQGRSPPGSDD